jgi:hypothetical protein
VLICTVLLSRTWVIPLWSYCPVRTGCQISVNSCKINSCSILEILAVESNQSSKIKPVEFFNTFPMSLDSFFSNEYSGSYELLKIVVSFFCQNLLNAILRKLRRRIWVGYKTKVVSYLHTILTNIYSPSFMEYFVSYGFLKPVVLQFEDRKQSHFVNCFRSSRSQNLIIFWIQKL